MTYLQRCTSPVNILILIRFYIILHANENPVLFGATYYCQNHMLTIQWNQYCLLTRLLCTIMLKFVHVLFLFTLSTKLAALPPVPHILSLVVHGAFHAGEEAVLQSKVNLEVESNLQATYECTDSLSLSNWQTARHTTDSSPIT